MIDLSSVPLEDLEKEVTRQRALNWKKLRLEGIAIEIRQLEQEKAELEQGKVELEEPN